MIKRKLPDSTRLAQQIISSGSQSSDAPFFIEPAEVVSVVDGHVKILMDRERHAPPVDSVAYPVLLPFYRPPVAGERVVYINLSGNGQGFVARVGEIHDAVSTSSVAFSTGSKVFHLTGELPFPIRTGIRLRFTLQSDLTKFVEGILTATSINGLDLTVNIDTVATGATGTGAAWNINFAGERGQQGIQGIQGIAGAAGSHWFTGSGLPSAGTGVNGDLYLRDNGQVYQKSSGSWIDTGLNIRGAQGIQGLQGNPGSQGIEGPQGAPGNDGSQWWAGTGAPSAGLGKNGDLYLRGGTTGGGNNGKVYFKSFGTWTDTGLNIEGPEGLQGPPGECFCF